MNYNPAFKTHQGKVTLNAVEENNFQRVEKFFEEVKRIFKIMSGEGDINFFKAYDFEIKNPFLFYRVEFEGNESGEEKTEIYFVVVPFESFLEVMEIPEQQIEEESGSFGIFILPPEELKTAFEKMGLPDDDDLFFPRFVNAYKSESEVVAKLLLESEELSKANEQIKGKTFDELVKEL